MSAQAPVVTQSLEDSIQAQLKARLEAEDEVEDVEPEAVLPPVDWTAELQVVLEKHRLDLLTVARHGLDTPNYAPHMLGTLMAACNKVMEQTCSQMPPEARGQLGAMLPGFVGGVIAEAVKLGPLTPVTAATPTAQEMVIPPCGKDAQVCFMHVRPNNFNVRPDYPAHMLIDPDKDRVLYDRCDVQCVADAPPPQPAQRVEEDWCKQHEQELIFVGGVVVGAAGTLAAIELIKAFA